MLKAGLIWRPELDCYECRGCGEQLSVPRRAVLEAGKKPVRVVDHPEHRLLWVELQTLDHSPCTEFKDQRLAQAARTFRRGLRRLSHSASRNERRGGRIAEYARQQG